MGYSGSIVNILSRYYKQKNSPLLVFEDISFFTLIRLINKEVSKELRIKNITTPSKTSILNSELFNYCLENDHSSFMISKRDASSILFALREGKKKYGEEVMVRQIIKDELRWRMRELINSPDAESMKFKYFVAKGKKL